MAVEKHFDCIIIGAGISGIDAAYHLNKYCSWATYIVLERRANLGGTWDFFKYPGIRSDSDMYTFGFSWKIWKSPKAIAPAGDILDYLTEAANEEGIMEKIIFNSDVRKAAWSTSEKRWHLTTVAGAHYSCNMLFGCTGYYSYEQPYEPSFKEETTFSGKIVHPQKWTSEDDGSIVGKRVAIIGSGATAVTLLPNVAKVAEHVTIVQRTPSYVGAKPDVDPVTKLLKDWLPENLAVKLNRWWNVILSFLLFQICVIFPKLAKRLVIGSMRAQVKDVMTEEDIKKHFTPPYYPWEQRFCLAPEGDFFASLRCGKASIVTDHIASFTKKGIQLESGQHIDANFIIKATGLTVQPNFPFSTMEVTIDGDIFNSSSQLVYKSVMLSNLPNMAFIMGYTNASWTLKADIACLYFVKLMNYMKGNNLAIACPRIAPDISVPLQYVCYLCKSSI